MVHASQKTHNYSSSLKDQFNPFKMPAFISNQTLNVNATIGEDYVYYQVSNGGGNGQNTNVNIVSDEGFDAYHATTTVRNGGVTMYGAVQGGPRGLYEIVENVAGL